MNCKECKKFKTELDEALKVIGEQESEMCDYYSENQYGKLRKALKDIRDYKVDVSYVNFENKSKYIDVLLDSLIEVQAIATKALEEE